MVSAVRIAHGISMKLRASFVHVHRAAVKHRSVQCRNGALGFSRSGHLHERDAPRFARIPVLDDGNGFDGTVGCKQFPHLLLRHRDVQVSNEDVGHSSDSSCSSEISQPGTNAEFQKAIFMQIAFSNAHFRVAVRSQPATP
jgi:hypothetical protein